MAPQEKEKKIEEARSLIFRYYNYLMDEYEGNASEEAIDLFLEEHFADEDSKEELELE